MVQTRPAYPETGPLPNESNDTITRFVRLHHQNSLRVDLPENTVYCLKNNATASPHRVARRGVYTYNVVWRCTFLFLGFRIIPRFAEPYVFSGRPLNQAIPLVFEGETALLLNPNKAARECAIPVRTPSNPECN
jgi:hypothetical protein